MDERYTLLATTEEVNERIESMAKQIITDYPNSGLLFVALLNGANPFANKLMAAITRQNIDYHPDMQTMVVSSYKDERRKGETNIKSDLTDDLVIQGRDVMILDDVFDTGGTAKDIKAHLVKRGAVTVRIAVLCDKDVEHVSDITPDYVGFNFGDKWLVGMGMDDAQVAPEAYRYLEEIWEVKQ